MIECLDELEEWAEQPYRFSGLRAHLLERERAGRRDGSIRLASARAADQLERGAARIESLGLPGDAIAIEEAVSEGLARSARRGGRRLARVEHDPADERFHDWRKRVKDLWYQHALVGRDKDLADRAHELSSILGDEHDLAVLRGEVDAHADEFSWGGEHRRITDLIVIRRDQLQGEAMRLGRPLYAELDPAHSEPSQASTSAALRSGGNTG
jgi:hypothetical protein